METSLALAVAAWWPLGFRFRNSSARRGVETIRRNAASTAGSKSGSANTEHTPIPTKASIELSPAQLQILAADHARRQPITIRAPTRVAPISPVWERTVRRVLWA